MAKVSPKDANFVPALLAISNADGKTILPVLANPSTHHLKASAGTTGSDNGPSVAQRDANNIPTLLATSSADGVTVVPIYCDPLGNLLIEP